MLQSDLVGLCLFYYAPLALSCLEIYLCSRALTRSLLHVVVGLATLLFLVPSADYLVLMCLGGYPSYLPHLVLIPSTLATVLMRWLDDDLKFRLRARRDSNPRPSA